VYFHVHLSFIIIAAWCLSYLNKFNLSIKKKKKEKWDTKNSNSDALQNPASFE